MPLDLISEAYDIPNEVDGILGLGYFGGEGGQLARQFVPEFIQHAQAGQGTFSSNIFAFNFDDDNTYVDLGEVDSSAYIPTELVTLPLYETEHINHWTVGSRGVMFTCVNDGFHAFSWFDHDYENYDNDMENMKSKNFKNRFSKNSKKLKQDVE